MINTSPCLQEHHLPAPPAAEIDRPNTMAVWTFPMAKRSLGWVTMRGIEALSQCDDPQLWRVVVRSALGKVRRGSTFLVYGGNGREMASAILHYRLWSLLTHPLS